MKNFILFLSLLAFAACEGPKPITQGTSADLAADRKARITDIHYTFHLDLPASKSEPIAAQATIRFNLSSTSSDVLLDFKPDSSHLQQLDINNSSVTPHLEAGHIVLPSSNLKKGLNSITIRFTAGDAALNRHDDYLYTLFVPARAATVLPVFDQPDLKAIFHLSLSMPANWKTVSQGAITHDEVRNDRRHVTFDSTRLTSTYQFAFAAGDFRSATDPESGMTMYYRETDSVKVKQNIPEIFRLHRESIAWLEKYTGITYPYQKFDFALMPAFQFGGMEHPGNIFYREGALFLDPSASVNEQLGRASLIAHETAHMWFGNLVTMAWFNDVWLKEVFANFMAAKMVNPSFPAVNHDLRFLLSHYPSAYDVDRTAGAHPIQQPLDNLDRAGSVYGAIIYQKAPIMMRNLERVIGEEEFRKGLGEYLQRFRYGNAVWDDLIATLATHTTQPLDVWSQSWIKEGGRPTVSLSNQQVTISNATATRVWPQRVNYLVCSPDGNGWKLDRKSLMLGATPAGLQVPTGSHVVPNINGEGYGYFESTADDIRFMLELIPTQDSVQLRAGMWMAAWDHMLTGSLQPADLLKSLELSIQQENDPLLLDYLSDKTNRIYWQFLSSGDRAMSANRIPNIALNRLKSDTDISRKRTMLGLFRSTALDSSHVALLRGFWERQEAEKLPLAERDRLQIAYALALRGQTDLVQRQLEQTSNPDRRNEITFILPVFSADSAVRDAFFEKLRDPANRTHEPWVLQSLQLLHHPIRGGASTKYVAASLDMLEEIRTTGDIFFPTGWLGSTLGYYRSREVEKIVDNYLKNHPQLPADLKNKLLQTADMMYRANTTLPADR